MVYELNPLYNTFDKSKFESGYSRSKLQGFFSKMLPKTPVLESSATDEIYVVRDGTCFPNAICLMVYRNFHLESIPLYRMTNRKHIEQFADDLQNLLKSGIKIKNSASDGDKSSVMAINKGCLKVPFQRCLVPISPICRLWLIQQPKHKSDFELKQIVVKIYSPVRAKLPAHHINYKYKRQLWLMELVKREEEYRVYKS